MVDCPHCGEPHVKPNEKKTDVNLVTALFVDAIENKCEAQVLVSGDGDYENALKELRKLFPQKELIVACPPARRNNRLLQPTTHTSELPVDESWFAKSQFKDPHVIKVKGKKISIAKPACDGVSRVLLS